MFDEDDGLEPTEYDPEADLPDYENELVSIPEAPTTTPEKDVPKEVFSAFWRVVVVVNYALFAVSLAPMLWYFRGQTELAFWLFASGVGAFGYAYLLYYRFKTRDD